MTAFRLASSLFLGAVVLLAPLLASAETLRADVIVFLRPADPETPYQHVAGKPDDRHAIALDDALGLKLSGIQLLPETDFGLASEWKALKARPGYERLLKLAYTQENPPASSGPALRLYQPVGDGGGLSGWLRLNAGKTGTVQADLEYLAPAEGGAQVYRVSQLRTPSKPAATQYLDGGRLGVLVKLSKLP